MKFSTQRMRQQLDSHSIQVLKRRSIDPFWCRETTTVSQCQEFRCLVMELCLLHILPHRPPQSEMASCLGNHLPPLLNPLISSSNDRRLSKSIPSGPRLLTKRMSGGLQLQQAFSLPAWSIDERWENSRPTIYNFPMFEFRQRIMGGIVYHYFLSIVIHFNFDTGLPGCRGGKGLEHQESFLSSIKGTSGFCYVRISQHLQHSQHSGHPGLFYFCILLHTPKGHYYV